MSKNKTAIEWAGDICAHCGGSGRAWLQPHDGQHPDCPECNGTGAVGRVRKDTPALDGRVWAELPAIGGIDAKP